MLAIIFALSSYSKDLVEAGKNNEKIVVLDADLAKDTGIYNSGDTSQIDILSLG